MGLFDIRALLIFKKNGVDTPVSDIDPLKVDANVTIDTSLISKEAKQDTQIAALGATTDGEATVNGSIIAILKRIRTLLGALPLPTGASSAANQAAEIASLSSLDTKMGEVQTSPTANTILGRLKDIFTALSGTLAISASSLPLPSGAATAAKQDTGNTSLSSIDTKIATQPAAAALADAMANPTTTLFGSFLSVFNGTAWNRLRDMVGTGDAGAGGGILATALSGLYAPNLYERIRLTKVFKTISTAASGNTAVWTPVASKKFRIMKYRIEVTADAAQSVAGIITLDLKDGASTSLNLTHSVFVPSAAGTTLSGGWSSGWIALDNGILSSAANNILNINLSAALTSGTVRVIACGTEE